MFSAILVVLPAGDSEGASLLETAHGADDTIPVIVIGTDDSMPGATKAFDLGAHDFIESSTDADRIYESLGLALGTSRRDSELRFFRKRASQDADWSAVGGRCDAMRDALKVVKQIVNRASLKTAPPILITGETGTGKGLLAKTIHFNSVRRNEPYVDVNCAAIPPSLIEAELLGHERGAFTDARSARPGLFETAHGGSLFLDEIAALRPDVQAKLLTVTEEKRVRRIGGRKSSPVDVQIIAATHRDLAQMVHDGDFREDLYHRLNVIPVTLPPLRERGEDKIQLAHRFVEEMCREYGMPVRDITGDAEDLILEYHWPGNVRELRNQIERIILIADDFEIRPEHFQIEQRKSIIAVTNDDGELEVNLPAEGVSLEALERSIIRKAFELCNGNVSQSARFLHVSRQTMIYRLKKHDIGNGANGSS